MRQFLLGSAAERVVRTAPCPVLAVRAHEREFIAPDALATTSSRLLGTVRHEGRRAPLGLVLQGPEHREPDNPHSRGEQKPGWYACPDER